MNCDSTSICAHSLKLEFLNEKYRELCATNNALQEQLNNRMQDPMKYLKLCEELTKVSQLAFFSSSFSCTTNECH
jgi:hypothetical protein